MKHVSGNLKYCRSISILIVSVIFLFSFLACYVFKEHVYFNLFSFDRKGPAVKETPKNVNNDHEVASESDQDVNSSVPNRKAEKTIEPLESCDIFTGEWVFDNITRPLYKEDECAFLRGGYLHEKWEAGFHVPELEMATERLFFSQVQCRIVAGKTWRKAAYVCWRFNKSKSVGITILLDPICHSTSQEEIEIFGLYPGLYNRGMQCIH